MRKLVVLSLGLMVAAVLALATPALAESSPVDVNTATVAELTAVNGIGPAKAQAIIDYRKDHGGFESLEDLTMVRGIGDKMLERIRPHLTVNDKTDAQ
jgi:competence protein ComEA